MTMEWETCAALIRYAYRLGGNTRDIARLTGLPHEDVATALTAPQTGAERALLDLASTEHSDDPGWREARRDDSWFRILP